MRQLQLALIAAESAAARGSGAGLQMLASQRESARRIGAQLANLEEERQTMMAANPQAAAALEAHLRVEVARARCGELQSALERQPADAAAALARERLELELEVASLEFDAAARRMRLVDEAEAWGDMRARTDALMGATEEFRISLALLEQQAAERRAKHKAARQAALKDGEAPAEIGGPKGLEPTRYGDWEKSGRCVDF